MTGLLALLAVQSSFAGGGAPEISMRINDFEFTPGGNPISGGSAFNYTGTVVDPRFDWVSTWNFNASDQFQPGASFIGGNFVVINITPEDQVFELVITMPTITTSEQTFYSGSVIASVTGGEAGGTGSTVEGSPLWIASAANGAFEQALLTEPLFASAPPFGSALLGSAQFINSTEPGPSLTGSMTITARFVISSGASLSLTTLFMAVPTPGAIVLLGIAGLFGRRRRRAE